MAVAAELAAIVSAWCLHRLVLRRPTAEATIGALASGYVHAAHLGIPYERADTVATDPAFVSSLVDVLEERAAQARGENPARVTVTGTGPFHTV